MTTKTILVALLVLSLACAAPASWNAPLAGTPFPPTSQPLVTTAVPVIVTPIPTPTLLPAIPFGQIEGNEFNQAMGGNHNDAVEQYYHASPDMLEGYTTRFGENNLTERVLWTHIVEIRDQLDHAGYSFLGGGAGYVYIDGKRYLLDDRHSQAWALIVSGKRPSSVDQSGQRRLLNLPGTYPEFVAALHSDYVGIVALKSPNDLGREYCLFSTRTHQKLGLVIVGDYARLIDWMPNTTDDDAYQLGTRYYREDGKLWSWAAELPNPLFYRLLENDVALATLMPPRYCYQQFLTPALSYGMLKDRAQFQHPKVE